MTKNEETIIGQAEWREWNSIDPMGASLALQNCWAVTVRTRLIPSGTVVTIVKVGSRRGYRGGWEPAIQVRQDCGNAVTLSSWQSLKMQSYPDPEISKRGLAMRRNDFLNS